MSRRVSLREFQAGLASRLKAAATEAAPAAHLGFEAGGEYWLASLDSAGEVLQVPSIQPVPLTREWFLGVANIRGALYSVSDLGAFIGRTPAVRGPESRLLLIGQPFGMNCALLVSRLSGLRNAREYITVPQDGRATTWSATAWRDPDGRVWRALNTEQLLAQQDFLDIAAH